MIQIGNYSLRKQKRKWELGFESGWLSILYSGNSLVGEEVLSVLPMLFVFMLDTLTSVYFNFLSSSSLRLIRKDVGSRLGFST